VILPQARTAFFIRRRSACETAVGPLQGQEGVANLSKAFLAAGGRSVISTLWQIDDNASLFLMRRFYAHLGAKRSPDDALRRAKLDFVRKFGPAAVPHLWAGYTFEGAVTAPVARAAATYGRHE
jgi:CHAT domain-containing protein